MLIIAIGFCFLEVYVNLSNIVALESLFFALVLLAGGVAATFLPITRADLNRPAGAVDVKRIGGLPTITLIGAATTALGDVRDRAAGRQVERLRQVQHAVGCHALAVVLLAGPVIYVIARTIRRQRDSLDLGMAMRELPPE